MHNPEPSAPATSADSTGDLDLASRAASGDEQAFECIMRRHNRLPFRTAQHPQKRCRHRGHFAGSLRASLARDGELPCAK
jgi:hypothetical protein